MEISDICLNDSVLIQSIVTYVNVSIQSQCSRIAKWTGVWYLRRSLLSQLVLRMQLVQRNSCAPPVNRVAVLRVYSYGKATLGCHFYTRMLLLLR